MGLDKSLRILNAFTRGRGTRSGPGPARRNGPHDPRHFAVRPGPDARPIRCSPPCATSATSSRTTSAPIAAAPGVCEDLALSPCENSCPLHMNIPRFLQLYKEGRLEDAFESVVLDNPLPASTGRVCQHPCDNRCRRQLAGRAGEHARSAPLHRRFHLRLRPLRRAGGAHRGAQAAAHRSARWRWWAPGPTGLTAAFYLALLGHEVTVYESQSRARRHAALRAARVPPAQDGAATRDGVDSRAWASSSCATSRWARTSR